MRLEDHNAETPDYAHSLPGRPTAEWQSLRFHLKETALLASSFADPFGSGAWAAAAGLLHDLGKASPGFQSYLRQQNGLEGAGCDADRGTHSSAGAVFAYDHFKKGPVGKILAYLVAGHHAGLPDWYPDAECPNGALSVRLDSERPCLDAVRQVVEEIASDLPEKLTPPASLKSEDPSRGSAYHLWVRMLYSCLVDADFLNTEAFMNGEQAAKRGGFTNMSALKKRFDEHMGRLTASAPQSQVNAIRNEILAACRSGAAAQPGIFSLSVPTGGGKTLSAMAFALDHAVAHRKTRILYVIPYTSIIEQTADVLRGIFGAANVVEHHSNIAPETETPRSRFASENWDAPVVVTTNVQFFESLYAAKASRCRKLHNIVNSVVILDEAQLLPPELLTPCTDALRQLATHFKTTIVLSTATQPALPGIPPPTELIPAALHLYGRLKRTEFHLPELNDFTTWEDIAVQLCQQEQVLCIVNTRKDCRTLHGLMPKGTIHLSALMCGEHRSKVIRVIKGLLRRGRPVRVVSTQLVEAGVDIDFPVVYRAMAGLDSIAQAGGRCNREGRLKDGAGHVHVFAVEGSSTPLGILRKAEDKTREMMCLGECDPNRPSCFKVFFERLYGALNDTGMAFREWLSKDVNPHFAIQFRTAAAKFRVIDDTAQRPVIVRYKDSGRLIAQLRAIGPTRDNMRRLQRYTVSLPKYAADRLLRDGWLEDVRDGILAQTMPSLYRHDVGLDIFREQLPPEDLIL